MSKRVSPQGVLPTAYSPQVVFLSRTFGQAESLCSFETLQFEEYDKVVFSYFDPEERRERHRTVFPEDCRKAFELGVRLANTVAAETNESLNC